MDSAPHSPERPLITRLAPLWRPIGWEWTKYGKVYHLDIGGRLLKLRACHIRGLAFLSDVYPDLNHWRRLFPRGRGFKIDTNAAASHFVRACEKAGEIKGEIKPDADAG